MAEALALKEAATEAVNINLNCVQFEIELFRSECKYL